MLEAGVAKPKVKAAAAGVSTFFTCWSAVRSEAVPPDLRQATLQQAPKEGGFPWYLFKVVNNPPNRRVSQPTSAAAGRGWLPAARFTSKPPRLGWAVAERGERHHPLAHRCECDRVHVRVSTPPSAIPAADGGCAAG